MKRAGFTMIELIFVIVILGILASVAVPKLIGVKDQADEGIVKGFVGTLNRTVGPSKWSASMMDSNGSVANATYAITVADTEFPSAFTDNSIDMTQCFASTILNTQQSGVVLSTADNKFHILCRDGNSSSAPRFWYKEGAASLAVDVNGTGLKAN